MTVVDALQFAWLQKLNQLLGLNNTGEEKIYSLTEFEFILAQFSARFTELIVIFDLVSQINPKNDDLTTTGLTILDKIYQKWSITKFIKTDNSIKKTGNEFWELIRDNPILAHKAQKEQKEQLDWDTEIAQLTQLYFSFENQTQSDHDDLIDLLNGCKLSAQDQSVTANQSILDEAQADFIFQNQYVDPDEYQPARGFVVFQSRAATGKTTALAQWIIEHRDRRILFIAPQFFHCRIIQHELHRKIFKLLKQQNRKLTRLPADLHFYYSIRSIKQNKLILSLESLSKLKSLNLTYDLLILDDISTIMNAWSLVKNDIASCTEVFQLLIKQTHLVIGADTLITRGVYQLLRNIRDLALYKNKYRNKPRFCSKITQARNFYDRLLRLLRQGKKLVIVWSQTRLQQNFIRRNQKILSNYRYLAYDDKSSPETFRTLDEVNKVWSHYDLIMYTVALSIAIDFTVEHFDQMFMYLTADEYLIDDMFKAMARVRYLKDNKLNLFSQE